MLSRLLNDRRGFRSTQGLLQCALLPLVPGFGGKNSAGALQHRKINHPAIHFARATPASQRFFGGGNLTTCQTDRIRRRRENMVKDRYAARMKASVAGPHGQFISRGDCRSEELLVG